ncbi:hypothetical protein L665_02490 [Ralstonia solanacearum SD54]|nr:hypothetical protein L665_02490 [Ralstonia solanacearum SD54]
MESGHCNAARQPCWRQAHRAAPRGRGIGGPLISSSRPWRPS